MFTLLSCGHHYIHSSGIVINRLDGAGNYAFVFFKVPSRVLLEDRVLDIPLNTYVLFRPCTPQFYSPIKPPFVNDWFHCDGEYLQSFLEEIDFPLDTAIASSNPMQISRDILELSGVLRQGGKFASAMIDNMLRSFFLKLRTACDLEEHEGLNRRYYRQFTALRNELYSFSGSHRRVEDLARQIGLSKSHFQHIYKSLFGVTVMYDIISSRLEHAKYLLRTGSYTVTEVATACGYENSVHFIRQFKKITGITPGKYIGSS